MLLALCQPDAVLKFIQQTTGLSWKLQINGFDDCGNLRIVHFAFRSGKNFIDIGFIVPRKSAAKFFVMVIAIGKDSDELRKRPCHQPGFPAWVYLACKPERTLPTDIEPDHRPHSGFVVTDAGKSEWLLAVQPPL